jgi:hypothetical protein
MQGSASEATRKAKADARARHSSHDCGDGRIGPPRVACSRRRSRLRESAAPPPPAPQRDPSFRESLDAIASCLVTPADDERPVSGLTLCRTSAIESELTARSERSQGRLGAALLGLGPLAAPRASVGRKTAAMRARCATVGRSQAQGRSERLGPGSLNRERVRKAAADRRRSRASGGPVRRGAAPAAMRSSRRRDQPGQVGGAGRPLHARSGTHQRPCGLTFVISRIEGERSGELADSPALWNCA